MAFNPKLPFRARDALAAGLTRRALASSRFRRLLPGVYVDARMPVTPLLEARAVMQLLPVDGFVSHHTAARVLGGVVPHDENLHASVPAHRNRSRKLGLQVHRSTRTPVTFDGVRTTSPTATFIDLAGVLGLVDTVVLGDSLVRKGLASPARLVRAAASAPDRLRTRAVRAAALVRARVDSPMETRTRLLLLLAGLPEPQIDIEFRDDHGIVLRRVDMGYREARLGIEYDGRHHATVVSQWEGDITRREEFDLRDWRLVTLVAKDIYRTPSATLERVVAAMRSRGMRVPPLRDEWRAHFPGR